MMMMIGVIWHLVNWQHFNIEQICVAQIKNVTFLINFKNLKINNISIMSKWNRYKEKLVFWKKSMDYYWILLNQHSDFNYFNVFFCILNYFLFISVNFLDEKWIIGLICILIDFKIIFFAIKLRANYKTNFETKYICSYINYKWRIKITVNRPFNWYKKKKFE